MKKGKNYKKVAEKIDRNNVYALSEALKLVTENKLAKFDESVEIHVGLNIDPKKNDQQVRGTIVLPHGTGKTKKVGVVTTTKVDDAKKAGADVVGGEDLIEKIKKGEIGFDVLVATPEMMVKLASVAKILGPRGLMPNPKTETVTDKVAETVEMLKKGKVSFKNDKGRNVHQVIGKASFGVEKLEENFKAFVDAIEKAKPDAAKGQFIVKVVICSTMGPGIKVSK